MHTCGAAPIPWHMQPTEGESRRVLLCACGRTRAIEPRGPIQLEALDYGSATAKAQAYNSATRGRAAAAADAVHHP